MEVLFDIVNRYGARLSVCRCIAGDKLPSGGHMHVYPDDPYRGWMCIRSARRLWDKRGRVSKLIFHELAHWLIPPENGHNEKWRKAFRKLMRQQGKTVVSQIFTLPQCPSLHAVGAFKVAGATRR